MIEVVGLSYHGFLDRLLLGVPEVQFRVSWSSAVLGQWHYKALSSSKETAVCSPVQVVDLISLKPFDLETISKSIKKTRKAIIVEECMKTGGIGASLSAVINETLFDDLDHQVRVCQGWCCLMGPANSDKAVGAALALINSP